MISPCPCLPSFPCALPAIYKPGAGVCPVRAECFYLRRSPEMRYIFPAQYEDGCVPERTAALLDQGGMFRNIALYRACPTSTCQPPGPTTTPKINSATSEKECSTLLFQTSPDVFARSNPSKESSTSQKQCSTSLSQTLPNIFGRSNPLRQASTFPRQGLTSVKASSTSQKQSSTSLLQTSPNDCGRRRPLSG